MSDLEQRVAELRLEIDNLKAALQTATDETERRALHIRLNDSIRASLRMIDERLQAYNTYLRDRHGGAPETEAAAGQHEPLQERRVGE